jgi:C4-dicarboxylate-specific signal transduction histidine kinase
MSKNETYTIRPAGRHVITIGKELIQDRYAAIVELVKNAYDADSPDVNIEFCAKTDKSGYTISISDHGHGMSRDTVINKWMVPSTDDKLQKRTSRSGKRLMQVRKGIGRYAAAILGSDLLLETITSEGEKTTVYLIWKNFEEAQYLDDVEILIETAAVKMLAGTKLTIVGDKDALLDWDNKQFDKLRFELKKLMPPIRVVDDGNDKEDRFEINLSITQFPGVQETKETIEPYPIFDLFDYKIAGQIAASGQGSVTYSLQKARNTTEERIPFDLGTPTGCGDLAFDIRVYDREADAIGALINRGLKDAAGKYVGKTQARDLLNEYNGIGVYRNGFRIRPLGDADFDWLRLNEQRVQNPSLRIGSNQVIGYVEIQSEEHSNLIEKSARDGLRENGAFDQLKAIATKVINELEQRRFVYRQKAGLSRPALKVEKELERLFSFDELKKGIRAKLTKGGLDAKTADEIIEIISKEEEEKNKIADDIRQAVAVYQGQATLGKIINVILHEGRQPLNYFKNQIPNLRYWHDAFLKTGDAEKLDRFMPIADGVGQNTEIFVKLFSRLDPLAAGKRSSRKTMMLKKAIEDTFAVFEEEMKQHKVSVTIGGPDDFKFICWPQDIYAIFTNLIDNSMYWMKEKAALNREINIQLSTQGETLLYVDYRDTGPGIEPSLIASEVIFEPQFSTKPRGTGLGLAIAGEAATRNDLELKAFESETGAYFRLQPKAEAL